MGALLLNGAPVFFVRLVLFGDSVKAESVLSASSAARK